MTRMLPGIVTALIVLFGCSDSATGPLVDQGDESETYQCGEVWDLTAGVTCQSHQVCGWNPLHFEGLACTEPCQTSDECSERQSCQIDNEGVGACDPWERVVVLPAGDETLLIQGCLQLENGLLDTPLQLVRLGPPAAPSLEIVLLSQEEIEVHDSLNQRSQSGSLIPQPGFGGAGSASRSLCLEFSLTRANDAGTLSVGIEGTSQLEMEDIPNPHEINQVSFVTRSDPGSDEERPVPWGAGVSAIAL